MDANARITYVNGRGRAELIRFLLSAAGVPFTEQFVESKEDLVALRESGKLLFNQLPLLEINSLCITQSAAMARYIARNYNLYGASEEERVLCDQIFDGTCAFVCSRVQRKSRHSVAMRCSAFPYNTQPSWTRPTAAR